MAFEDYKPVESEVQDEEFNLLNKSSEVLDEVKYESHEQLKQTKSWRENSRVAYQHMEGKEFDGTDEELSQYGYNLIQSSKWAILPIVGEAAGSFELAGALYDASPEVRKSIRDMRTEFDNTGDTLSDFGRALGYVAADPASYIGGILMGASKLGTKFGIGKLAGQATADKAMMSGAKGAIATTTAGGAGWGLVDELGQQSIDIETRAAEGYDAGDLGISTGLGATIGAGIGIAGVLIGKGVRAYKGDGKPEAAEQPEVEQPKAEEQQPKTEEQQPEVSNEEVRAKVDALPPEEAQEITPVLDRLENEADLMDQRLQQRALEMQQQVDQEVIAHTEKLGRKLTYTGQQKVIKALEEDLAYESKLIEEQAIKRQQEILAENQVQAEKLDELINSQVGEVENKPLSKLGEAVKAKKAADAQKAFEQELDPSVMYPGGVKPEQSGIAADAPVLDDYIEMALKDVDIEPEVKIHETTNPLLKEDVVRGALQRMSNELTTGKTPLIPDPSYVRGESDTGNIPMVRSPSVNPEWFKREPSVSVSDVRKAVAAAISGKKLGAKQSRIIDMMIDEMENELDLSTGGKSNLQSEIEAGRAAKEQQAGITREELIQQAKEQFNADNARPSDVQFSRGEQDYRMQHTAPMREDFDGEGSLDNLAGIYGDEIYSPEGFRYYQVSGGDQKDKEAFDMIQEFAGQPGATVTIYRALPTDVNTINPGDWVTLSKEYAQDHAASEGDKFHIISQEVKASDIFTNGDSWHEWGYDPEGVKYSRGARPINETPELNGLFERNNLNMQAYQVESPLMAREQRRLEMTLGKKIVFIDGENLDFNGVFNRNEPNKIYINTTSSDPYRVVIGHEALHSMKQNDPQLYDELFQKAMPFITTPLDELSKKHPDAKTMDGLFEEAVADLMGEAFTDDKFWDSLTKDPTLFERAVKYLYEFIEQIRQKYLSMGDASDAPVKRISELQDVLEDYTYKYIERNRNVKD